MTTQKMFKPARRRAKDWLAWHEDSAREHAEERERLAREAEELEEAADKARQAILAADAQLIIENACIAFNGLHASIDPDTGDLMVHRVGVSWYLTDAEIVAFVYGGFAARTVSPAEPETVS